MIQVDLLDVCSIIVAVDFVHPCEVRLLSGIIDLVLPKNSIVIVKFEEIRCTVL